jgi:5-methylcytosine-specific restriction endonuclease McrA
VRAARVIKDIPEVYDLMKDKKLSFSAVLQIANVLDAGNKNTLLPRVVGKSKSQIDRILVEYQLPQTIPDMAKPRQVKKQMPAPRACTPKLGEISLHSEGKFDPTVNKSTPEIEIVLEKMFEIRFAADDPQGASFLEIFKYALSYIKHREDLVNYEARSCKSEVKTSTRYIPKAVKQKVWKRDKGKCTFVGSNNKRCNSEYKLQFDHYPIPYARGGPSTANNLRLLCAKHNKYTAEQIYGKAEIKKHYIKEVPAKYIAGTRLIMVSRYTGVIVPLTPS